MHDPDSCEKDLTGMITSSWTSQFIDVCGYLNQQRSALTIVRSFFAGSDEVARMQLKLQSNRFEE